jgi:hypothetical protein
LQAIREGGGEERKERYRKKSVLYWSISEKRKEKAG